MEKVLDWRRFRESDWFGYAGAEKFPDGADPLIADVRVDGADATVIWDGDGVHVDWEEGESVRICLLRADGTDVETTCKALLLREEMTSIRLRKLGFEDLGLC